MRHRRSAVPLAAVALASALLAGCAEVHRGVEAVGRVGAVPTSAAADDPARPSPAARTVQPRGAPSVAGAAGTPSRVAAAVPSPRDIFDFHPAGTAADGWRQPFVIDPNDGPLAADVRRSAAELRQFLADRKKGGDATAAAGKVARPRCGENEVARGEAGCGPAPRRAAAMPAPAPQ